MTPSDITIEILKEIRDSVRGTNQRIDGANERLDQTNERLDQTIGRLDQANIRLDRVEGRLGKVEEVLIDLAQQQRFMVRYLRGLSVRDERLGDELADLRVRVESLESKVERKGT